MRKILFLSLTVMVSLSGLILAMAEGAPLAGLTILVAVATLIFVDLEEAFAVPVLVANTLGLIAFCFAGFEFFSGEIESRLLAGGHLIVYLTWVNLIQKKSTRQIWWLSALSILQIATASVLTSSIWFGGMLIVYLFVATWTLSVFLLYRSTRQFQEVISIDSIEQGSTFVVGDSWKGVSRDVDHRLLNFRFVLVSGVVTCLALMISLLFFVFTPRVWIGNYALFGDEAITGRSMTGFTEEVRLGDMSEIMENSTPVLEVSLYQSRLKRPLSPAEAKDYFGPSPLFRGTVMEFYENGRWKHVRHPGSELNPIQPRDSEYEQRYRLSPLYSNAIFAFGNVAGAKGVDIYQEKFSDELKRNVGRRNQERTFEYTIYADPGDPDTINAERREGWGAYFKMAFAPSEFYPNSTWKRNGGGYIEQLLTVPKDLDKIITLTRQQIGQTTSPHEKVQKLFDYLNSDQFEYSVKLSIQDPTVDPLEDFLLNRKSGHCEYYASAMAIMLRCADIPSRLISGFKGGSFDSTGQVFRVQQLHAHSWVEAFIDGKWVTIDPTPPVRDEVIANIKNKYYGLAALWLALKQSWSIAIHMSETQQQEMIYTPLQKLVVSNWNEIKNLTISKESTLKSIWAFLKNPERWFSVTGGIVAFILMVLLSGLAWSVKRLVRLWRSISAARASSRQARSHVQFYDRFVQILARMGIYQRPAQTAREFVQDSIIQIQKPLKEAGLTGWPDELVDLFYSVRFGGESITPEQSHQLNRELIKLQECVDQLEGSKT